MENADERLVKVEARAQSNTHRIDKLEKMADAIHEQNEILAKMVVQLENNNNQIGELSKRVGVIENRPGALWDKLVGGVVGAIATGLVVALLAVIIK